MLLNHFQVEFYKKENGNCPILEFFDSLDCKKKAKVLRTIDILERNGNELREPYSKLLVDGIFELRIRQGTDIVRVLYFFYVGKKIILTHGFTKKTQKTPQNQIEKAKEYKNDYYRRNKYE